jgi:hypothetical protein
MLILCFCIRGLPGVGNKKVPFRQWYGNLSELRSLISDHVRQIVVTATVVIKRHDQEK